MANDLCCILSTFRKCMFCNKKICRQCFEEVHDLKFTDPDDRWVFMGHYDKDEDYRCNSLRCAYLGEQALNWNQLL